MKTAMATLCPYRGLQAFREEDAPFFFGRDAFADQPAGAVKQRSLVAVVGASGSCTPSPRTNPSAVAS